MGFAGRSQREAPERFEYVISTEQEMSITVKKIVVALLLIVVLSMAMQAVCYASPTFSFNIGNTGQNFNVDDDCENTKTIAGSPCTFLIDRLSNVQGAGVKFVGMNYHWANLHYSWVKTTNESGWVKSAQSDRILLSYSSGWADKTNIPYSPGARIDDDYNGTTSVGGRFNADRASS